MKSSLLWVACRMPVYYGVPTEQLRKLHRAAADGDLVALRSAVSDVPRWALDHAQVGVRVCDWCLLLHRFYSSAVVCAVSLCVCVSVCLCVCVRARVCVRAAPCP